MFVGHLPTVSARSVLWLTILAYAFCVVQWAFGAGVKFPMSMVEGDAALLQVGTNPMGGATVTNSVAEGRATLATTGPGSVPHQLNHCTRTDAGLAWGARRTRAGGLDGAVGWDATTLRRWPCWSKSSMVG